MANPVFSNSVPRAVDRSSTFTVAGAAWKTLCLIAVMASTFAYTWNKSTEGYSAAFKEVDAVTKEMPDSIDIPSNVIGLVTVGILGGLVVGLITIFNQSLSPYTAPVYAALEGLALGAISAGFEAKFPGIVMQAMIGVIGTAASMAVLYSTGLLRPSKGFVVGILSAMTGIVCLYTADLVIQLFGGVPLEIVHGNSTGSIILSVVIVCVAALNLIIDFDTVTEAAEGNAPKWYEWYAAFGILITIVWLYLEILKLLAKAKSSDD